MFHRNPTRSPETEAEYERTFQRLRLKFEKGLGVTEITPNELAAALLKCHELGQYAQRTWRVYKAAVLYCLRKYHPECQMAIEQLENASSAGLPKTSRKKSGLKSKKVLSEVLAALVQTLNRRIGTYKGAQDTLNVVQATLLTGLRPNEWANAAIGCHLLTGRPVLQVRNSKHSNGRANGKHRSMFIDQLTQTERKRICDAIKAFEHAITSAQIKKKIKALQYEIAQARAAAASQPDISRATKEVLSHVTIYSFRHQFVADAKRALTGTPNHAVVLAALLGHNSVETAPMHYGRRRHGGVQGLKVLPTPESVAAVQQVSVRTYEAYLKSIEPNNPPATARNTNTSTDSGFGPR